MRKVVLRIGIVLAPDGGALAKMLPVFQLFAGGPLGELTASTALIQLPCSCPRAAQPAQASSLPGWTAWMLTALTGLLPLPQGYTCVWPQFQLHAHVCTG